MRRRESQGMKEKNLKTKMKGSPTDLFRAKNAGDEKRNHHDHLEVNDYHILLCSDIL